MSRVSEAMQRVAPAAEAPAADEPLASRVRPAAALDRFDAETPTPIAQQTTVRAPVRVEPRSPRPIEPAPRPIESAPRPIESAPRPIEQSPRPIEQSPAVRNRKLIINPKMPPIFGAQYRRLAAALHEMQQQNGIKVVMVSSAVAREGKTLTVANLALTLSESYHRRTLAIDGDLRRPRLHEIFGMAKVPGLGDVLAAPGSDFPLVQASPWLSVLTAGHVPASPLAQLASDRLRTVIDDVAAHFDWVLIDTPPISIMPDAQHVASVSQGVLLVIAAGATPYPLVQRAVAAIGADRIVGTMLNHADPALLAGNGDYRRYLEGERPRA